MRGGRARTLQFNLEVEESDEVRAELEPRRRDLSSPNGAPLLLEVTLHRPDHPPTVVEQWRLHYDTNPRPQRCVPLWHW